MSLPECEESSDNSVTEDWRGITSVASFQPMRPTMKYFEENDTATSAISFFDSDSDSAVEMQQSIYESPSLLLDSFNKLVLTDEEDNSYIEDCMILSDEDDYGDDDENDDTDEEGDISIQKQNILTPSTNTIVHDDGAKRRAGKYSKIIRSPRLSSQLLGRVKGRDNGFGSSQKEMAALFVDDKPWRRGRDLTSWKRRNRKFLSTDRMSLKLEEETENIKRIKGGIFRKKIGNGNSTQISEIPIPQKSKEKIISEEEEQDDDCFEEDEVSIHSSQLSDLDLDGQLNWSSFSFLPNSFLGSGLELHPSMSHYLEEQLQSKNVSKRQADQFALEHSLLLRAILQLLEERQARDFKKIENFEDSAILKQGPLKKFSHTVGRPIWKVKYAEVRRGNFSYYEDSAADSKAARKSVPLANCICQEVRRKVGNFAFELLSDNSPRRLFMCSSEEERQAWMRIIEEARKERKKPINLKPYQWSIDTYKDLQMNLRHSLSKAEYMLHFGILEELKLQFPIQWILDEASENNKNDQSPQKILPRCLRSRTINFMKFLQKHTLIINGHSICSESLHGPERIIGALSRCILEYNHSSSSQRSENQATSQQRSHLLTEVQAVSDARDVLVAVWQARVRDDSHYALHCMCQNESNLIAVLPKSDDPNIHVSVSYLSEEINFDIDISHPTDAEMIRGMSGWVATRSKSQHWKNRFCVVSEGVLNYYENESPRPHGLRGQVVLVGASIGEVVEKAREDLHLHILEILEKDSKEVPRQLSFKDRGTCAKWKGALEEAINSCSSVTAGDSNHTDSPTERRRKRLHLQNHRLIKGIEGGGRIMKTAAEGGGRIMKTAAEGSIKVIRGASEGGLKVIKGAIFEKMARQKSIEDSNKQTSSLSSLLNHTDDGDLHNIQEIPSVQVKVESCRHYKIITADPTGYEDDTWVTVRANTCQLFKISSGPNGKLTTGLELVEMVFFQGLIDEANTFQNPLATNNSDRLFSTAQSSFIKPLRSCS